MKTVLVVLAVLLAAAGAHAQVPVAPDSDHEAMLRHADPQLPRNTRLVRDVWREVLEAGPATKPWRSRDEGLSHGHR
jgi:hypothetical protein